MNNARFSIHEITKRRRATKRLSREQRRNRLKAWAGIAEARLKHSGGDPSKHTTGELAMMHYRQSKKPILLQTQEKNFKAGRHALLNNLERMGG